jgi:FtsZ-binding cell division protein ZapB
MQLQKIHEKIRLLKLDPENFKTHTVETLIHLQETINTLTSQADDMFNEINELKNTQKMLISENKKLKAVAQGFAHGLNDHKK